MNEDLAQNSVVRRFRPALVDFGTAKGWSLMGGCRSAQTRWRRDGSVHSSRFLPPRRSGVGVGGPERE
jgi:hypothetical protein